MFRNREVKVVFQPKDRSLFANRRRFGIGVKSLPKYVGKRNAETAIARASESDLDKCTVKFRKHGRIDFYFK